jgi:hypothetical protein
MDGGPHKFFGATTFGQKSNWQMTTGQKVKKDAFKAASSNRLGVI